MIPRIRTLEFRDARHRDHADDPIVAALAACFAPFGSLPSGPEAGALAHEIIRWVAAHDLEAACRALRVVRSADCSQLSALEIADFRAAITTPTSGTVITVRCVGGEIIVTVDLGSDGSTDRASTILLAAQRAGVGAGFIALAPDGATVDRLAILSALLHGAEGGLVWYRDQASYGPELRAESTARAQADVVMLERALGSLEHYCD